MKKTLRELVDEAERSTKNPSRARKKPRTAKKRSAKKNARGRGSNSDSPMSDSAVVAASPKPRTELLVHPEERYRRFAEHLILGRGGCPAFNATEAYRLTYDPQGKNSDSANRSSASALMTNPNAQAIFAEVALESWNRQQMDEVQVAEHWKHIAQANIFDYFDIEEDPARPGCLVLKSRQLKDLPIPIQRNIKKIKVKNRWVKSTVEGDPPEVEQTIELEILDRLAALRDLARWKDMFAETQASDTFSIAEAIRKGQERIKQAVRLYNNDAMDPK